MRLQHLPFKYLGVLLVMGGSKSVLFDGLISAVWARLNHWSTLFLSTGGKIILIRHILNLVPLYLLQVIKPRTDAYISLHAIKYVS